MCHTEAEEGILCVLAWRTPLCLVPGLLEDVEDEVKGSKEEGIEKRSKSLIKPKRNNS